MSTWQSIRHAERIAPLISTPLGTTDTRSSDSSESSKAGSTRRTAVKAGVKLPAGAALSSAATASAMSVIRAMA